MGETVSQKVARERAEAIAAGVATAAGLGVEVLEAAAPEAAQAVESVAAAVVAAAKPAKKSKAKR